MECDFDARRGKGDSVEVEVSVDGCVGGKD